MEQNSGSLPLHQHDPTASPSFETKFASLSLHKTDRIRLVQFSQSELLALRSVIEKNWRFGIQDERLYSMSHEFKLYGNPWCGQGEDAIPARLLMRGILAFLFSAGWILTASTNVSKKEHDKDTLVFRKQTRPPPTSIWIAISFNESDRLRLIGAQPDLIDEFRGLLRGMNLLQEEFWKERQSNAYEFKIYGSPWLPEGEETMSTRLLILKMVALLERFGWSLYASIGQNDGPHWRGRGSRSTVTDSNVLEALGGREAESWYCVRALDWVPGMAVFHR